jgi:hypothetical protein
VAIHRAVARWCSVAGGHRHASGTDETLRVSAQGPTLASVSIHNNLQYDHQHFGSGLVTCSNP